VTRLRQVMRLGLRDRGLEVRALLHEACDPRVHLATVGLDDRFVAMRCNSA
jgi:hypothetical protein